MRTKWIAASLLIASLCTALSPVSQPRVVAARLRGDAGELVGDERFSSAMRGMLRHLESNARAPDRNRFLSSGSSLMATGRPPRVLHVVYSGKGNYDTRLKWVTDTWAAGVRKGDFVVIGDEGRADRTFIGRSMCPKNHWEGACCKYAEGVIRAYDLMEQDPELGWVFLSDDDVYLRPQALAANLNNYSAALGAEGSANGTVRGTWGCGTKEPNCDGLCAGGGYAADRKAVFSLLAGGAASFMREQMDSCSACSRWADIALSQLFKRRGIASVDFDGLYPWKLSKSSFDLSLASQDSPPLLYHYINQEPQFRFLHALFRGGEVGPLPTKAATAAERCASFEGRAVCGNCSVHCVERELPWLAR